MQIEIVPVLKDNYSYLAVDPITRTAASVDPGEAAPILETLEANGWRLSEVWITHSHHDHIGGLEKLLERTGPVPVICSHTDRDRVPHAERWVRDGDRFEFAAETVEVLEVPGHSDGHIAFHLPKAGHLFSGDLLFGASCGAVFTKDFEAMYRSLEKVRSLPPKTQIWCGHEYTQRNLGFAETVLGEAALRERRANFRTPSVPLLLKQELATNPFLQLEAPAVQRFTGRTEPVSVLKTLRERKDQS